jgi:transcriptional regulator with XRE-family HTH domain
MSTSLHTTTSQSALPLPTYAVVFLGSRTLTYADLCTYHLNRTREALKEEGKTEKQIQDVVNNTHTAFNKWLENATWLNRTDAPNNLRLSAFPDDPIGDELSFDFNRCLKEHLDLLEEQGRKKQTIDDRKSQLKKLRKSLYSLLKEDGLPQEFSKALDTLFTAYDVRRAHVASACDISSNMLKKWHHGVYSPTVATLPHVKTLELYFGLTAGTLVSRLKLAIRGTKKVKRGLTPFRQHSIEMLKKPFCLQQLPAQVKPEWDGLYRLYTDGAWAAAKGYKRGGPGWKINERTGKSDTAEAKLGYVYDFFGYLHLPSEPKDPSLRDVEFDSENKAHQGVKGLDPHVTGKGFKLDSLSLVLLADVDLVYDFIQFYRGRTCGNVYNSYVKNFLAFCAQLIHPKTGYLTQTPSLTVRLPAFVKFRESIA